MSIRNFDALFAPKSIALIGASNQPGSVGAVLAANLTGAGFAGPVMLVNPHEATVAGRPAYASVAALPETPDVAVIATPAPSIPGLVAQLGARGCRAAIVISTGFGGTGAALRQAMLTAARPHLMRIVGPNCLGVVVPEIGLNASFALGMPHRGSVALVSQSGAIIAAMLDWAAGKNVGFSHVVSLGDMADADFGDMLDYLALDRATRSILLYVENVTEARKFMSAARIASRAKPVVVVKAGRSKAGAKAALSHTGALAGSDAVYDAAFRRAGLLRVDELDQLFEAASLLATGVRVGGNRLAIVTNGGGAGVLATDALEARGGVLAALSPATMEKLDAALPAAWSHGNPIDVLGDAEAARYEAAFAALDGESGADAVLVINCPTAIADGTDAARAVCGWSSRRPALPILTNWLGGATAAQNRSTFGAAGVPTFDSPETAVRAFMNLDEFRRNQAQLLETPGAGKAIPAANVERARRKLAALLGAGRTMLTAPEANELLGLFGIPATPISVAATAAEAARVAGDLGGPVALKILSADISHKSEVGGVALGLETPQEVERAAEAMRDRALAARPGARLEGFMVQPMVVRPKARELIVGIATDACFGPVILFGQGGTATEIVGDRVIGLPPLNSTLAKGMIARTRVSRLLAAYRNVPAADIDALSDTLVRISDMATRLPEIAELDINPLLVDADGVLALDARVVLAAAPRIRPAIEPYPDGLEQHVVLPNGQEMLFRPIRPEDEDALSAMVEGCTPADLRLRFFNTMKALPREMAARLSQIDYDREMAFVAVRPTAAYGEGPIFGVARIIADPENETAEFAVIVRSDMQGHGLGYSLMEAIIAHGRRRGLKRIRGDILTENARMLAMVRELGFTTTLSRGADAMTAMLVL